MKYTALFPHPVRCTRSTLWRFCTSAWIASSWCGRNTAPALPVSRPSSASASCSISCMPSPVHCVRVKVAVACDMIVRSLGPMAGCHILRNRLPEFARHDGLRNGGSPWTASVIVGSPVAYFGSDHIVVRCAEPAHDGMVVVRGLVETVDSEERVPGATSVPGRFRSWLSRGFAIPGRHTGRSAVAWVRL